MVTLELHSCIVSYDTSTAGLRQAGRTRTALCVRTVIGVRPCGRRAHISHTGSAQTIEREPHENRRVYNTGEAIQSAPGAPAPDRITRSDGTPIEVLVVDDEPALSDLLSMVLRYEGWTVTTAADGAGAIRQAAAGAHDIVVLDVMLPDMSGLDVLQELHRIRPELPVLLLTAKDTVEDRIAGLAAGGDDYVTKPFSIEEMILRLRALVKRSGRSVVGGGSQLVVGDLVLDEDSYEVTRAGETINLTATEFAVLRLLMLNPRRVLTKSQILQHVWDYDFDGRSNVVELYISYLRKKVDAQRPSMIHTVRGVGYVIKPQ